MKSPLFFAVVAITMMPISVLAHETQQFRIGGTEYKFVIGSLNEPVVVDDKTGLDLTVSIISKTGALISVNGLEQTLKVELSAGDKKKEMPITTQYGKPGGYKATFFPTVQTTLGYRLFGTINNSPVDLSFTCNPAGHPQSTDDTTEVEISEGITRTLKRGAFGCPAAKAELGFPEPAPTLQNLQKSTSTDQASDDVTPLALSIVALVLSIVSLVRRGKRYNAPNA